MPPWTNGAAPVPDASPTSWTASTRPTGRRSSRRPAPCASSPRPSRTGARTRRATNQPHHPMGAPMSGAPTAGQPKAASPFKQPKAVYALAFACVVSFMGIGLVDPILPAISSELDASPSQVTMLFTSYLLVTAVAMLFTGWISSHIGAKRTLIYGLSIIVVFSALAGFSESIGGIVGFRAGWGVGNAMFIATSLAVIVASASGGFVGAIVLYEAALGLGMATGPLLGGLLGNISWRGPFLGVAGLMLIALVATITMVAPTPKP